MANTDSTDDGVAVTLVFTNEQGLNESVELAPGVYMIGRGENCHVRVPTLFTTVSRQHAQLTVTASDASIEDLGSEAGCVRPPLCSAEPRGNAQGREDNGSSRRSPGPRRRAA